MIASRFMSIVMEALRLASKKGLVFYDWKSDFSKTDLPQSTKI